MTIGDLPSRNAAKFPEKMAVVSEGLTLTFKELNGRVNCLANFFLALGARKGDRIGVLTHNCHQFVELYFAAAKIGATFCPYNNHLRLGEIKDILDYSTPRFLVIDHDFVGMIDALRPHLGFIEKYICLQKVAQPFVDDYESIIRDGRREEPDAHVLEDDLVSIFFTGGTMGRPKGVMRTHRHVMSNAVASVIELKVDYDEKVLITFPLYHVAGEDNVMRHSFMPNTIHIRREGGFDAEKVLGYISGEGITRCQFVPTMIHSLVQAPGAGNYDLSALQMILYAGAAMPVELLKKALTIFPCGFTGMYGLTESGPVTTLLKPKDHVLDGIEKNVARLASCGKPLINYEIKIADESDNDLAIGQVGEIVCRSEAMTIGYWQMPEETARILRNGWLHTGDLGRFDEDGYLYVVERKDDMIVSGGVNIYPREVEEILYRHPGVSEASVIGLPDEHWGEIVKAVIVPKEGALLTEEEMIEFCGKNLASFKKPKSVDFWKELPKSPQGKILKKEIRRHYRQHIAEEGD